MVLLTFPLMLSLSSLIVVVHEGIVTFCDSTLNTANLCPAISVVGLFYF